MYLYAVEIMTYHQQGWNLSPHIFIFTEKVSIEGRATRGHDTKNNT